MHKPQHHTALDRLLLSLAMLGLMLIGPACGSIQPSLASARIPVTGAKNAPPPPVKSYLPIVLVPGTATVVTTGQAINLPFFQGGVRSPEAAIFWYGKVSPNDVYTDVRVGYSPSELTVSLAVIDRRIWYDLKPSPDTLTQWDGATLLISTSNTSAYRLDAQFSSEVEPRAGYQAAYQWNGSGWQTASLPFTSNPGWRGDYPNNNIDDKGWAMTYHIPFTSLGLSGAPADQTIWHMALQTHNRDSAAGPAFADKVWPDALNLNSPATWGNIAFGVPVYTPPGAPQTGAATIRNLLNGASVSDAGVGGGMNCGAGTDYWNNWGDTNESFYNTDRSDFNVQNESDISDYPCFSKTYMVFPMTAIPPGKVILSARLTLHQFGNSQPPDAKPSFIQIMSAQSTWDEKTITWNNAPQVISNVGGGWVDPLPGFPGWPGVVRTLDVSLGAANAYAAGGPLSLVLYSADDAYHSGKYFVSSNTGDWNAVGRPTLDVTWGNQ
jgi:hypothetical protein